jgi:hypothetical protein
MSAGVAFAGRNSGQRCGITMRDLAGRWRGQRLVDLQSRVRGISEPSFAILLEAAAKQAANQQGRPAGSVVQFGSPRSTAASVSETPSPWNARAPVSISYSSQPKAHTSVRLSAGRPSLAGATCTRTCRE